MAHTRPLPVVTDVTMTHVKLGGDFLPVCEHKFNGFFQFMILNFD